MKVGNVVLIKYEDKCRPGTYRLGVVRQVLVSPDGLVRDVLVEYSLVSELPADERKLYKGVTKKTVQVPVQRLVLILPVEEQTSFQETTDKAVPLEEVTKVQYDTKDSDKEASHIKKNIDISHATKAGVIGYNASELKASYDSIRIVNSKFNCQDYERFVYKVLCSTVLHS